MKTHQSIRVKAWLKLMQSLVLLPVAFLWPAGTWHWWEAWAMILVWSIFMVTSTVILLKHDPELLAERLKTIPIQKGQKSWDKVLMMLLLATGLAFYILPGLDVMRFGWSEPFPVWIEITALMIQVPGLIVIIWTLRTNTYLFPVVKISKERKHHVITHGPYAYVRHPMYAAVILLGFAVPISLGSRYGLIPALCMAGLFIVRTIFEERTLKVELPGYSEYTKTTQYRLMPGIW